MEIGGPGGPQRPPRIGKIMGKPLAHNSLLISVIRPLAESNNYAERDAQKAKLEMNFKRIDQQLDELVATHHEELGSTMQVFSKISTRVSSSKEQILTIKEKLTNCKALLHCKREELKKLWLESVEQKHVLNLLDEIEQITEVPAQVEAYARKKHFLHATQLLVSSVELLDGKLDGIDALKDVKACLITKKDQIHEVLVDELQRHLYIHSMADILKRFKQHGMEKRYGSDGNPAPSVHKLSTSMLDLPLGVISPSRRSSRDMRGTINYAIDFNKPITENINLADPEENSPHFIAILAECLFLLNKIPEAVDKIKERCEKELLAVIRRTAQHILDHQSLLLSQGGSSLTSHESSSVEFIITPGKSPHSHLLLDLVHLLFQEFKCVASAHDCLLGHLKRKVSKQNQSEINLYEMADFWSKVQAVFEIVIGEYLDIHNTASARIATPAFSEATSASDIAAFFDRKRPFKPKKFALFRFDSSSHAMSMNAYYQEQKEAMKEKSEFSDDLDLGQQLFVCPPHSNNITVIFKPMMSFINEIEQLLGLDSDQHCSLHSFLTDCVKVFLGEVVTEVDHILDNVNKTLDTWKTISDPEVLKFLDSSKPLLQSTVLLDKSLRELQERMLALPMYSDQFLGIICSIVNNYKETCQAAYKSIVKPERRVIQADIKDKGVISYNWINDADVNRLLRGLASWQCLEKHTIRKFGEQSSFDESPAEVRLRNQAETKIMVSTMAMKGLTIPLHEILPEVENLRMLALLQESMNWLSMRISRYVVMLPQTPRTLSPIPVPTVDGDPDVLIQTESHAQVLKKLSKEFLTIAETCLLILHLEVRVHCFYYLQPITTQGGSFAINIDRQEPDPEIIRLNKDLTSIDEAMNQCLQAYKHRYIFEGLGSIIAYILMNSVQNMRMINENGVKKMCRNIFSIQQMLTSITMSREVDLDYARQYFELFYHTPDEILSFIVERGPQFQEQEYINALALLHNSQDDSIQNSNFECLKEKLQNILNKVPVAV